MNLVFVLKTVLSLLDIFQATLILIVSSTKDHHYPKVAALVTAKAALVKVKRWWEVLCIAGTGHHCTAIQPLLRSQSGMSHHTMNTPRTLLFLTVIVILASVNPVEAQLGNFLRDLLRPLTNLFRPVTSGFRGLFGGNTISALRSDGRDPLFPADCGRDDQGKGKLCFGDPDLCRASKLGLQCQ